MCLDPFLSIATLIRYKSAENFPIPFKFENMWLQHSWETLPPRQWAWLRLQQDLKKLRNRLKIWNKITFGNVSQAKDDLLQKIEELDEKKLWSALRTISGVRGTSLSMNY